jgi:Na+-driven multidrug efflux pump
MFVLMPVFGINQGVQPILGYNYGAKQYGRVRSAYFRAVAVAICICTAGFLVSMFFPSLLLSAFSPNASPQMRDFFPRAMRAMVLLMPLVGYQVVSTNFFTVTGRPKTSIILSLLRQVFILLPLIIVFGLMWGLDGVIAAAPVSDAISISITTVFIIFEMKKLPKNI